MSIYVDYGIYSQGGWRACATTVDVISPVTEAAIGAAPVASTDDTLAALESAAAAREALEMMGGFARADALHRAADRMVARRDEAARIITLETGKPIAQSAREWGLACDQFRWYAEESRRIYGRIIDSRVPGGRFEVHHPPVGIVGAFTAWNFPAALPARKLAPALAAGCPVVLRPSSQTPGTAMIMVDCLHDVGLPAGAVSLIVGPTANTYAPVMADARVRKVSLTGSTRIGQQMIRDAAESVKKVSMELGGNAPLIVYEDADLESALDVIVPTKFANAGQVCVTPDRFFVHQSLYDDFVDGFIARTRAIKLGDGLDEDVGMGPLINANRVTEMENIVADALNGGARVEFGGQRATAFERGHFFEPTVLTRVSDDMRVFAEENFGPIAAITAFREEAEAIQRANASPMGLSAYAFTRDAERARHTVSALNAGMVGINSFALAASEAPFGGTNFSGMGREGGAEGITDYLDTKLAQIVF